MAGSALPALSGTAHAAIGQNPPALWYKIAGEISDADAVAAASRYRVVIMQSWQTAAARRIKSINPGVTVLAYKDLSCGDTSSAAFDNERNNRPTATGVGYLEAEAAGWVAKDSAGRKIQWRSYPTLYQLETWDPAYRARWVSNVVNEIKGSVWDGVFGDDALTTLRYYSDLTPVGAPNDAAMQAAMGALIGQASQALHAVGKKLVVNIAAATDNLSTWQSWTRMADGAMLEHFGYWGGNPASESSYLWDWGSRGWTAGVTALGTAPLNVAVTSSADGDQRSYRYGLASFLIATGGRGAFTAVDSYHKAPLRTEQSWDLGYATGPREQDGPVYARAFQRGFAAVNPSNNRTATISVPAGLVDVTGRPVSSLTLPPLTGAVLKGTGAYAGGEDWIHHTPVRRPVAKAPARKAPAKVVKVAPVRRPIAPVRAALPKPVAERSVVPVAAPAAPAPVRKPSKAAEVVGALVAATSVEPRRYALVRPAPSLVRAVPTVPAAAGDAPAALALGLLLTAAAALRRGATWN